MHAESGTTYLPKCYPKDIPALSNNIKAAFRAILFFVAAKPSTHPSHRPQTTSVLFVATAVGSAGSRVRCNDSELQAGPTDAHGIRGDIRPGVLVKINNGIILSQRAPVLGCLPRLDTCGGAIACEVASF